jgi:Tol biopolymer transport system component
VGVALAAAGGAGQAAQQDSREQIWSIRVDGTGLLNLSRGGGNDFSPAVSPDGRRIAFVRDGNQLWVMNLDGSGQRSLGVQADVAKSWSPDGKRIAFTSESDALGSGVWVVNADGSGLHRLMNHAETPLWAPRSERLVVQDWDDSTCPPTFATNCAEPFLETVRSDGTDLRTIARRAQQAAWSPSGKRIAYAGESGNSEAARAIYVANADGSRARRIFFVRRLRHAGSVILPRWSPDGRLVSFLADGPNGGFFSARPDGSQLHRLPRGFVSWSPRGHRILLTRAKGFAVLILVARLDGSHASPLVTLPSGFESLDWTPDGRRVIYTTHD